MIGTIITIAVIAIVTAIVMLIVGITVGRRTHSAQSITPDGDELSRQLEAMTLRCNAQEQELREQQSTITRLTSERDVERAHAKHATEQLEHERSQHHEALQAQQIALKESFDRQLSEQRDSTAKLVESLREMNQKQVETQMTLIREQMQTTSESVLKAREEELGARNIEQVSKIVDPLQQSIKLMREALNDSKEKHQEALHRLDATIQANMRNSEALGETAERLTRALTGEVKVQGNFGELKLRQLLEDLGLKDGEQFSSQEHLRDSLGKRIKDDEDRNLIPDFVLHFPNNRDVIVDSKMSFTAYERYMNTTDAEEQSIHLKEHLRSVRAQVDRLAKKDYSRYLKDGYAKLNFVIMYIHTEGALNLAMLNDGALWREAYDRGVLILGPQTMYMNLRILELMWTQMRQLENQEEMINAANMIIDRTQDFVKRFGDVESKVEDTMKSIKDLKITTGEGGKSIITAARSLIKAGARENRKKRSLGDSYPTEQRGVFLENESPSMLESSLEDSSEE